MFDKKIRKLINSAMSIKFQIPKNIWNILKHCPWPSHAHTMVETPAQPTPEGGQTKPSNPFFRGALLERSLSRGGPPYAGRRTEVIYPYSPYLCARFNGLRAFPPTPSETRSPAQWRVIKMPSARAGNKAFEVTRKFPRFPQLKNQLVAIFEIFNQ